MSLAERWRVIPVLNWNYQMSDIGRVRRKDTLGALNPVRHNTYGFVYGFCVCGAKKTIGVEQLFNSVWPGVVKTFSLDDINAIRKMNGASEVVSPTRRAIRHKYDEWAADNRACAEKMNLSEGFEFTPGCKSFDDPNFAPMEQHIGPIIWWRSTGVTA